MDVQSDSYLKLLFPYVELYIKHWYFDENGRERYIEQISFNSC